MEQSLEHKPKLNSDDLYIAFKASGYKKRDIYVHTTFIKFGEVNTLKECFDADVLVRSKWRVPELDMIKGQAPRHHRLSSTGEIDMAEYWNPKIYIDNSIGDPKITKSQNVEYFPNGEAWMVELKRFKGTFMEQMELLEFPFDTQDLGVIIMSEWPKRIVELHEDPDEIHKIFRQRFIEEQEWYLYKYVESESKELLKDRADPSVKRSALLVRAKAARHFGFFLFNNFSLMLLITSLAFVTFCVKEDLPQNRLQLSFTLVLTAVAFKFVVNQSLPKISYLTYMDRYIMANMVTLAMVCFWHGIQTLMKIEDYPHKDYWAMGIFGGLYLIYNIQFILRILLVPFKKRRELFQKEHGYRKIVREQGERKLTMIQRDASGKEEDKRLSQLSEITTRS